MIVGDVQAVIDAHQHFYDPARGGYPWLEMPEFAPVRRVFAPEDLQPELERYHVIGTVLVQTWSSLAETQEFLALAAALPYILGVVGWVDLTAQTVADDIDRLRSGPGGEYLVGIRHQVHDEVDPAWLLRDDVQRGLAAIGAAGLVYDLLVRPRELGAALAVCRRHHELRFVVDHIGKPHIRSDNRNGWMAPMTELACCANVFCKASGLVTEADWRNWNPAHLATFVDDVIRLFGKGRVLFGSDWPVCLVAARYGEVLDIVRNAVPPMGPSAVDDVFLANAVRCYGLSLPPDRSTARQSWANTADPAHKCGTEQ